MGRDQAQHEQTTPRSGRSSATDPVPSAARREPVLGDEAASGGAPVRSDRPGPSERPVRYEGAGITAGFILLLVAGVAVVIVVAQNSMRVPFEFLWWEADIPLAVLLLATALLVLVVDALVGMIWRGRRRRVRELTSRHRRSPR